MIVCNNFKVMQLVRGLLLLNSFGLFLLYGYIYVSAAFTMYGFYAIATTFSAFLCLFLGSGKQVVYQKLVDSGKIDYSNKKKKSNLWLIGVFLYGQAIPMVITINFVTFISSKELVNHILPEKYHITNPHYQSFKRDMNENLEINYTK